MIAVRRYDVIIVFERRERSDADGLLPNVKMEKAPIFPGRRTERTPLRTVG